MDGVQVPSNPKCHIKPVTIDPKPYTTANYAYINKEEDHCISVPFYCDFILT
jgi:hypothetical protein